MAQINPGDLTIDPTVVDGTDLAARLERFYAAEASQNSGPSRPASLKAGGIWAKTGQPNSPELYLFDGTKDVLIMDNRGSASTLDDVTGNGNTTTNDITVGNLTSKGIDDNATSTAVTIDATGRVGIGDTNPTSSLHISTGGSSRVLCTNGTQEMLSGVWAGLSRIENSGSQFNIGTGSADNLVLRTNNIDRVTIDPSGALLAGLSTNTSGSGATGKINSRQDSTTATTAPILAANEAGNGSLIIFSGNGGGLSTANRIHHNGANVTYGTSSDERLKKNIAPAPSALAVLNSVEAVSFDWKATDQHTKYGFIAQQIADVVPDAVIKGNTDDEPWGMDYGKVTPFLLKAIQEQQAMIEELRARVATLEAN